MDIQSILLYPLWGYNIVQWLLFIGIVLGAFVGSKALYWVFAKVFHVLTKKIPKKC